MRSRLAALLEAPRWRLVRVELLATGALLAVTAVWSATRDIDLGRGLTWSTDACLLGLAVGLAFTVTLPLVTAPWARRVLVLRGLRRAWDALESGLGPGLRTGDVVVLAVCSAISEELFFRGVVQAELGLVPASLLFGLLHPLGLAYVVWATVAGAGLGALYLSTGSLLAPAVAHGVYNLLALDYLRRRSTWLTPR